MAASSVRVGSDYVQRHADRLVLISHVEMMGWEVRRHRPTRVRFDGRVWTIGGKSLGADGTVRYELVPVTSMAELPGIEVDYTADFVTTRDREMADSRRRGRVGLLLRLTSVLVGFLPAQRKAALEARYRIDPVASTWHSVYLEAFLTLTGLAATAVAVGSLGFSPLPFMAIAVVMGVDACARAGRLMGEDRPPSGFYEWARPTKWR